MTPEQIRELVRVGIKENNQQVVLLGEIAFQIAILNENVDRLRKDLNVLLRA